MPPVYLVLFWLIWYCLAGYRSSNQKVNPMGHPNLSPELNAFIKTAQTNSGFEIGQLPENALFEIHTQNSVYTIVVVDPKAGIIALMGTRETYEEPDLYAYLGSTWAMGASALKLGWVGVDLHARFQSIDGQLITTTKLQRFVMLSDPAKAAEIRTKAEARRPGALEPASADKMQKWQEDFDKQVAADFAGEHLPAVQQWLSQFSIRGKCNAANFFAAAKGAGKLKEALELMPRHFKEHWMYKPPEIRGDTITPSDTAQWQKAGQEIGLPSQ